MNASVRLLGPPAIALGGTVHRPEPSRVAAALYYLAYRGGWVAREELLALFWPDSDEGRARASLRQLIAALRASPLAAGLEVERSRVRWSVPTDHGSPPDGAARSWTAAGPLLDGFRLPGAPEFEEWLEAERAAVVARRRRALRAEVDARVEERDERAAVRLLEAWLDAEPLDEAMLARYLELAAAGGRTAEAEDRFVDFERRLERELGLTPSDRVREAAGRLRDGARTGEEASGGGNAAVAPATAPAAVDVSTLPRRPTVLFGRDEELAIASEQLRRSPGAVLVFVGAGGMGKTSLAVDIAHTTATEGRTAVFVSAVEHRSADETAAALADVLGDEAGAGAPPRVRAGMALARSPDLVVLDNVEQVPDIEDLIEELRPASPRTAWVLTSRRRLALRDAETLGLEGVGVAGGRQADRDGPSPAARLFIDRARRSGVTIVGESDVAVVEQVVAVLAGVPLAIELAAGWVRLVSVAGVLERVRQGLALDAAPGVDVEARHASVRRVFDASWVSLGRRERSALARLGVFRGGCTLESASEVADLTLPEMAALRDASMLRVSARGRIGHHPLVAGFVRERAGTEGVDLEELAARHASHYLGLVATQETRGQAGARDAFDILQAEHQNVEAAWEWALQHEAWDLLVPVGSSPILVLSYWHIGLKDRWSELVRETLDRLPQGTLVWAHFEGADVERDWHEGRRERALARHLAAHAVIEGIGDPFRTAWSLFQVSRSQRKCRDVEGALASLERADELLASIDEVDVRTMVLDHLHATTVDLVGREAVFERGEAVRRQSRSTHVEIVPMLLRAFDLSSSYGQHRQALEMTEAAIALARREPWPALDLAGYLCDGAQMRLVVGDIDGARAFATEAVELGRPFARGTYHDHGEAVRALASACWLGGEIDAAWSTLRGPEADLFVRGGASYELEARLHLEAGDVASARAGVESLGAELAAWETRARGVWLKVTECSILDAEVALAEGRSSYAAASLAAALSTAVQLTFVPAQLAALGVAVPLLERSLAHEVHAVVAAHPGTVYADRRRLGLPRRSATMGAARTTSTDDELRRVVVAGRAQLEKLAAHATSGDGRTSTAPSPHPDRLTMN